jgi:hypothetical protein
MRKFMTLILLTAMLVSAAACGNTADAAAEPQANAGVSAGANNTADAETTYVYGQIDSISGNDVVLLLADYNENYDEENADADAAEDADSTDEENSSGKRKRGKRPDFNGEKPEGFTRPENGEMPEDFDPEKFKDGEMPEDFTRPENGEMPEGFDPEKFKDGEMPEGFDPEKFKDGEMPEGFDPEKFKDGEMPEGFTRPENGEMPEGFDPEKFGGKRPGGSRSSSRYALTGEQQELRIPVGTTVTTALGVETDFEALSTGDIIKCSIAKDSSGQDVVTAVWIMEK